jgi:hypothetical protein
LCLRLTDAERLAAHIRHERNSILAEQADAAANAQAGQEPAEKPE